MKNIEKYYDELKNGVDINRNYECWIRYIRTGRKELLNCDGKCICCYAKNLEWLNAEYVEPIKLTNAEKVILENLDDCWKWITRDNVYKTLEIHMTKPLRNNNYWESGSDCCFGMFDDLFQFVKWENEPLEIAWLLENCEVIEE